MKIEIQGMEERKVDFKLKLIKGFQCFRLVEIDERDEEYSVVEIDDNGFVKVCFSDLKDIK